MVQAVISTTSVMVTGKIKGHNLSFHEELSKFTIKILGIGPDSSPQMVQTQKGSLVRDICHSICIFWIHLNDSYGHSLDVLIFTIF